MMLMTVENILLPLLALIAGVILLRSRFITGDLWRATITPLASIIGSGFLIVAPLLAEIGGSQAIWLMLVVLIVAYAVGEVIRFNIGHIESLLHSHAPQFIRLNERIANICLSFAYIISVSFYLRLLSSFVLHSMTSAKMAGQVLTTIVLTGIGYVGWRWGLRALERLEIVSVTIKLVIIAVMLLGLFHYDVMHGFSAGTLVAEQISVTERLRMLAGMLLVVQGFETSRYLGNGYSVTLRIKSMRLAQGVSAMIYLSFVFLITPIMHFLPPGNVSETAIIPLTGHVVAVLPFMLIFAAIMSQFSAAVGDTLGAGGLIDEETGHRIHERLAYVVIVACGIALVWWANIFEIVTLASRAFAAYYLVQTFSALYMLLRDKGIPHRLLRIVSFSLVALCLIVVVLFAIPVG